MSHFHTAKGKSLIRRFFFFLAAALRALRFAGGTSFLPQRREGRKENRKEEKLERQPLHIFTNRTLKNFNQSNFVFVLPWTSESFKLFFEVKKWQSKQRPFQYYQ
jgi:hypothetical protein